MRVVLPLAMVAALSGCSATRADLADQRALAEARPIGEPLSCVPLSRIRSTRVRDDRTIDFKLRDGRLLRNTLPARCPGLGFEESFSYRTSLSQLCSVDTITVLYTSGPPNGATCGLGRFQPIEHAAN